MVECISNARIMLNTSVCCINSGSERAELMLFSLQCTLHDDDDDDDVAQNLCKYFNSSEKRNKNEKRTWNVAEKERDKLNEIELN